MRIKSLPSKHQEQQLQETIDILSIDQFTNPESNQNDNCLEPLYEVESIIMKKIHNDDSQYLVKWKGYSELTWEPLSSLQNCQLLLEEFDQQESSKNVIITTQCVSKKAIHKSQKKSKKSKKRRPFENEDQIQSFQNLGRTIKINGITNQQLKVNFKKSKNDKPNSSWINLNELHEIAPKKLIQFYESLPAIQALFKQTITTSNLTIHNNNDKQNIIKYKLQNRISIILYINKRLILIPFFEKYLYILKLFINCLSEPNCSLYLSVFRYKLIKSSLIKYISKNRVYNLKRLLIIKSYNVDQLKNYCYTYETSICILFQFLLHFLIYKQLFYLNSWNDLLKYRFEYGSSFDFILLNVYHKLYQPNGQSKKYNFYGENQNGFIGVNLVQKHLIFSDRLRIYYKSI